MKLTSMTDFVVKQQEYGLDEETLKLIFRYANFLKQKLELWMFVPCKFVEGVWVVLEEPKENDLSGSFFDMQTGFHYEKEYQEAKDRVLFKWFKKESNKIFFFDKRTIFFLRLNSEWILSNKFKIIEDILKYNLELTPNAKKQIEL